MFAKVKQLFDESVRDVQRLAKLAAQINEWEPTISSLSDEQLRQKTVAFKERLECGETLDDIKTEAFAVVREAARRVLGLRHYDVQLMGGLAMHEGNIAEMQTGEGKTLAATLPSYLHALLGKGVHIITANEYLARRDYEQMGRVFRFLGLTVGLNVSQMTASEKKEAYAADITYGTGTEFGFDYLRDNMVHRLEDKVQRPLYYAIIDEIDSILIDEARTPLIIANKSGIGAELFPIMARIVRTFEEGKEYERSLETKQIFLTEEGAQKIERAFGIDNLYDWEHHVLLHHAMQSLRAWFIMRRDVDYIVKNGKVMIVDPFTGRVMEGRSFSDGLHQAIEAKEGVDITEENDIQATITIQNYFRMYEKLAGMTGSATPSKEEFWQTYRLRVMTIPTNRPSRRTDWDDLVYQTYEAKVRKIIDEVKKMNAIGRPVLIGTTSVAQSERLSAAFSKAGIPHHLLNAKTEEEEARIIATAGQKGQVMIATNMAGRGTDILLGEGVKELGGLHIIGTERHESHRIDMQLRGRAGRQGDPGSSQFIISLEDDLFRLYDQEELEKWRSKVKTDETGLIVSPDPIKFVQKVQTTIENAHYSARLHLLKLDTVIDQQSKVIYHMRDRVLALKQAEVLSELLRHIQRYITQTIDRYCPEDVLFEEWNIEGLHNELRRAFFQFTYPIEDLRHKQKEEIALLVWDEYQSLEAALTDLPCDEEQTMRLKHLMVETIDAHWIRHLNQLNVLKEGIHLRSYGQEDPYRAFEMDAYREFVALQQAIDASICTTAMNYLKSQFVIDDEAAAANEP
ncbi:accessory Sec system translocase SecA2 [Geobacillus thermocatenulatus]|uniref:accessory Sec system translocase SecA2 n=1 Tax=Geobacillus thermocatenulatus TaxID=33938 RepID=UPI0006B677F9|nr:Protein translocase subunit SecA [Geobacillus sp. BCO2]